MRPRVLIVISSDARRGAEIEGVQLAAELTGVGFDARAVALSPSPERGVAVECLGRRRLGLVTLRRLRQLARSYDIVVAYGSSTLPACAIGLVGSSVPFVYRSIGDPTAWVRNGVHRWRTGLLFRRAAAVVALWPAAAAAIERLYGVDGDRLSCIPNARPVPAASTASERAASRAALGLPPTAQVVAWVGAFSAEKRPVHAVAAVGALPGAWLAMAGTGPLLAEVEVAGAAQLDGRHRLFGMLDSLAPLWRAADVVLSTSRTEGMPGVLIEAALLGVPAVATDVGAVAQLVQDGVTGRLVAVDADAATVAAALGEVLQRRGEFGSQAVAHAQRFTWERVVPLWADLLVRCTSPASGPQLDRG